MKEKDNTKQNLEPIKEKRPNEQVGFHFSSSLKIHDPESKEVLLQMRCD
jgi:hypothetical protein